jgi:hypothetical protein
MLGATLRRVNEDQYEQLREENLRLASTVETLLAYRLIDVARVSVLMDLLERTMQGIGARLEPTEPLFVAVERETRKKVEEQIRAFADMNHSLASRVANILNASSVGPAT